MEETISVRIPREELKEIENISKHENATRSAVLREALRKGIKEKLLELALKKFQENEVSISKAAKIAGIPLTKFLDILFEKKINLHYDLEDLREDAKNLGLI